MATRSMLVFADVQNGEILNTYCHFDGYPGHMMKVLPSYDTEEKVRELLNMGDASSIVDTLEASIFYSRDRGEDLQMNRFKIVDKYDLANVKHLLARASVEYLYFYLNGTWIWCQCNSVRDLELNFQV